MFFPNDGPGLRRRPCLGLKPGVIAWIAVLCLAVATVLTPANARADGDHPEAIKQMRSIFAIVKQQDGYLTQRMHAQFWAALTEVTSGNEVELKNFWATLAQTPAIVKMNYIREAVRSMRRSARDKRISLTPDYALAKKRYLNSTRETERLKLIKAAVERWESNQVMVGNALYNPSAQDQKVLDRKLDSELSRVNAVLGRFDRLRGRAWTAPTRPNSFQSLPFSISWPDHFIFERRDSKSGTGKPEFGGVLRSRIDRDTSALIVFLDRTSAGNGEKEDFIESLANNALKRFGASNVRPVAEEWRGMLSARGAGSGVYRGKSMHTWARAAALPNNSGFIILVALSRNPKADDRNLFAELQVALQFTTQ